MMYEMWQRWKEIINKEMTIASCITCIRFFLIYPIYVAIISSEWTKAGSLLFIAGCTDLLDGFVARFFNQVTYGGALFDALSDKFLMIAVHCGLLRILSMPFLITMLVIMIIIKEVLQLCAAFFLWRSGLLAAIKPLWIGKVTMFVQICFTFFIIAAQPSFLYLVEGLVFCLVFFFLSIAFLAYKSVFFQLMKKGSMCSNGM